MSRSARQIPQLVAAFGEKQFKETGAEEVEVLRLKASTLRKYFKQLKGALYLVAVISRDRVRVYFFNRAGMMMIGDNLDTDRYEEVRKASKLITKFEKEKPPTEEELRMEATEDLRNMLSKAIRKVARALGESEPDFPRVFVTKEKMDLSQQGFGIILDDDSFIIHEAAVRASWAEGIANRIGFLLLLQESKRSLEISQCTGNFVAYRLLKDALRPLWFDIWSKVTKESQWEPLLHHFILHADTYDDHATRLVKTIINKSQGKETLKDWLPLYNKFHSYIQVDLGTADYHTVSGFCSTLKKPRKLSGKRHVLDKIHLAPRAICNPLPIDIELGVSLENTANQDAWLDILHIDSSETKHLFIDKDVGTPISFLEYYLNLEDIFPKSGGLFSRGMDIVSWVLGDKRSDLTFSSRIAMEAKTVPTAEKAVLERLIQGDVKILSDSLIGSPQRIDSLFSTGCIVIWPDFQHIGLDHEYLLVGEQEKIRLCVESAALEATIIGTDSVSYGVVSAPGEWGRKIVNLAIEQALCTKHIISANSTRNIVRTEKPFPEKIFSWASN
ncbi:MAG: hypothetical protein BAJATHORv1_40028 [Candidatus Thorarchaeota archaeon]|nr:MAG: hypothetical protein BAJATHORv1_40028 [Candidatus Thorarchaeota archaeon]